MALLFIQFVETHAETFFPTARTAITGPGGTLDRFANALDKATGDEGLQIRDLQNLARQYVGVISRANLVSVKSFQEEDKATLQLSNKEEIGSLISALVEVACNEMLVNGELPEKVTRFLDTLPNLRTIYANPKESMIAAFSLYIHMRIMTTPEYRAYLQQYLASDQTTEKTILIQQRVDEAIRMTLKNTKFIEHMIEQGQKKTDSDTLDQPVVMHAAAPQEENGNYISRAAFRKILDGYQSSGFFRRTLNERTPEIDRLKKLIPSNTELDDFVMLRRDQIANVLGEGHRTNVLNGTENPDGRSTDKTIVAIRNAFKSGR